MGFWNWLMGEEPEEKRDLESFIVSGAAFDSTTTNWRTPSLREALGIPAVFRAVTMLSNIAGSLAIEAYRDGRRMPNPPRIVQRPNPFTTPRDFIRDTVYSMATRGEALWWVAARDIDGQALSLIPINPVEITIEDNPKDRRYPIITWGTRRMPNKDIIHITYAKEPGTLRGVGPLQMCGAAVSVAVESQEWAANFFGAGGVPSVLIKSAVQLDEAEAKAMKEQWVETPNNQPKVVDTAVDSVTPFEVTPQSAQLSDVRMASSGEVARMFGIPGSMLEYNVPGSSLTYSNNESEMRKFIDTCLGPNYLEPIEQSMSDLLTRSTVAYFNVDGLQRADLKTRAEVYKTLIDAGVEPERAADVSGMRDLTDASVEVAPIPPAFPQSIPSRIPER